MMKLGVRAHDFGRREESELPKVIREAGFTAVQLALTKTIEGIGSFQDVTPGHLDRIGREFRRNGVEISVLGCYVEPSLPDREARLAHVDNFLLGLEHAKALGVNLVATETTNFDPSPEMEPKREETYQNLKDSVLRMVEKAESLDITVGIETVADHTLNSAELTRRLLDEVGSDKLKVVFDPVNLILAHTADRQDDIYQNFFEVVGPEIVAFHLKDIVFENREKVWRNIGEGIVNQALIFDWLHQNKPDIAVLREHVHMDSYGKDVAAMRSLVRLD